LDKYSKFCLKGNIFIHATADVQTQAIGDGTSIWQFSVVLNGARIGKNVNICSHCFIEESVKIGNDVTIKNGVYLWNGISVEDNVFIGPNVTFTNDKYPFSKNIAFNLLETIVKKGASIGAGAVILPGITVGKNALVAAGAVVTKSVPDNHLAIGVPAKMVKNETK
jgi:UDP-2-acetamido-3-amino-2,3-dideoxy-glucuronate N-acetyltransferase